MISLLLKNIPNFIFSFVELFSSEKLVIDRTQNRTLLLYPQQSSVLKKYINVVKCFLFF